MFDVNTYATMRHESWSRYFSASFHFSLFFSLSLSVLFLLTRWIFPRAVSRLLQTHSLPRAISIEITSDVYRRNFVSRINAVFRISLCLRTLCSAYALILESESNHLLITMECILIDSHFVGVERTSSTNETATGIVESEIINFNERVARANDKRRGTRA